MKTRINQRLDLLGTLKSRRLIWLLRLQFGSGSCNTTCRVQPFYPGALTLLIQEVQWLMSLSPEWTLHQLHN
jgi:hypothetical protein